VSSSNKTIRLKLSPEISKIITGDADHWNILSRQHSILLEFAEGLCNLGKLDFSMIRIMDGYYNLPPNQYKVVTVSISLSKHPKLFGLYLDLPYKERGMAMSCLLLMATKIYKESDNSAKLEVLRYSKVSEDIVIPGLNAFDTPSPEIQVSKQSNKMNELDIHDGISKENTGKVNEGLKPNVLEENPIKDITKLNPSIFEDMEDLEDIDTDMTSESDYTRHQQY